MAVERNNQFKGKEPNLRWATHDTIKAIDDAFSPMGWPSGIDYRWNELATFYTDQSTGIRVIQGAFSYARQQLDVRQQRSLIRLQELGGQHFPNCDHKAFLALFLIAQAGTIDDTEKLSKSAEEVLSALDIDETGNAINQGERKADVAYVVERLLAGEIV